MATESNTQRQHGENDDTIPPRMLKGWEAVRMRPGMYIGDVGVRGLHYLFKEILDNAVDEVIAGYCTEIDVVLSEDYTVSVSDNGRGIQINVVPESGKNGVEHVFTELTFRNHINLHGDNYPKVAGGLRGVGASTVNALCDWLACEVKRGSKVYQMQFERGIPVTPLEVIGKCSVEDHGTKVTWLADKTMFKPTLTDTGELAYDGDLIARRCQQLAYHLPNTRITFHDRLHGKSLEKFHYQNGIADYVQHLN